MTIDKGYWEEEVDYPSHYFGEYPSGSSFSGEAIGYDVYESESTANPVAALSVTTEGQCQRPLRMVCVGPNFRVGGVRQHALALAKFLDPAKVKITGFVVSDIGEVDASSRHPMPVPTRPLDRSTIESLNDDCDILLMWGDAYNLKLTCRKPLKVFVAHGETLWTRQALVNSSQVVDHVIAVSESVLRKVCHGFPATKILNGIDSSRLSQTDTRENVRRRYAFTKDDFVVGCVGRLTQEKGFDLMIRAVSTLPSNHKLLIVGRGRRYAEWLDLANRLLPGRCAIVTADDYLGDFYQAMDAFGLVSLHEGFGLVLAEAMMAGRPVFSTRVGAAPEILCDRINGVFVEPAPEAIADTIRHIRDNPDWAEGMSAQGKAYAISHLQASQMARRYEDLLCKLFFSRQATGG